MHDQNYGRCIDFCDFLARRITHERLNENIQILCQKMRKIQLYKLKLIRTKTVKAFPSYSRKTDKVDLPHTSDKGGSRWGVGHYFFFTLNLNISGTAQLIWVISSAF
jgi:hypothetical protein